MCIALLWTVNDFLGKVCFQVRLDKVIECKTVYVGYRCFLPTNHFMRKSKVFEGKIEIRPPPRRFTNEDILRQSSLVKYDLLDKHEKYGGIKKAWP